MIANYCPTRQQLCPLVLPFEIAAVFGDSKLAIINIASKYVYIIYFERHQ